MKMRSELTIGPPQPTFLTLVLKTFAGFGAGIAGTLILLVIFLTATSILQPTFSESGETGHPLFIFVFMATVFLTSLGSNIVGSLFFSFVQHDKYLRTTTAIYQVFFVNLIIFAVLAPVYLLVATMGLDVTAFVAGLHVVLAALSSLMILEIVSNIRYAVVGVYGVVFSILFSLGIIFTFYQFSQQNLVILLFITLPVIWTSLGFISVIVEMFYRWLYTLYGMDFLMTKTEFGADYGEEEEEPEQKPDVEGSSFLKRR